MKLAVSSSGTDLKAQVDPRFGRCPYFIIVDPDSGETEVVPNTSYNVQGGSGIESAEVLVHQGVDAVLTGNIGPNAVAVLNSAGINIYTGASGTIEQALDDFKSGRLAPVTTATAPPHAGMGKRTGGRW